MIPAHTGIADSAERKSVIDQMFYRVVDAYASRTCVFQHPVSDIPVLCKDIKRQRTFSFIDKIQCFLQFFIRQYRQNRPEQFLLHGSRPVCRLCGNQPEIQNSRSDKPLFSQPLPAVYDPLFICLQYLCKPVVMLFIYDPPVIRISGNIFSVKILRRLFQAADKGIPYLLIRQYIVRSNTGLSRVQKLPPHNPSGRRRYICRLIYDNRTLPAQLQRHRNQILGRRFHDKASGPRASRKENIIKPLF